MLMGYARVSKADGTHLLDLQREPCGTPASTKSAFTKTASRDVMIT